MRLLLDKIMCCKVSIITNNVVAIFTNRHACVQKWVDTPLFSGQLPTLGLWMVGHQCAGMSIREDCYDIIGNDALFAVYLKCTN
jgi:glutathionylspermidine synthase